MSDGDPVLADVVQMITEVVGDDEFLLDVPITCDTTFGEDLALESIEFVALAEKLQQRYAGRVDFTAFLADLDLDQIIAMTVGQLVGFIKAQGATADAGSKAS